VHPACQSAWYLDVGSYERKALGRRRTSEASLEKDPASPVRRHTSVTRSCVTPWSFRSKSTVAIATLAGQRHSRITRLLARTPTTAALILIP